MKRFTLKHLLIACALVTACSAVVIPLGVSSARKPRPSLKFRTVRGGEISVAPLDVTHTHRINCPRGYVATGYGVLLGADELVYADPTSSGRGYAFSFANPSEFSSYSASASVRCATGRSVRVYAVSSSVSQTSHAALERAARRALRR